MRALTLVLAAAVAVSGGVVADRMIASAQPETEVPSAIALPPPAPLARAAHRHHTAAMVASAVTVDLPVPAAPPSDDRAPTPEIRHGVLEIPAIGLSQPFFEGVTLTAIDRGPSHWPGTAMPGAVGNVVIAGHRTTRTRPFWDLDLLQPGDELIFTMDTGARWVYALDHLEIVDDEDIRIIEQGYGYTATLFACHPKGSARQRIVAHFTLRPERPALATPASGRQATP